MILFFILLLLYVGFVLWMGGLILEKAGLAKGWVFCLLIPIINIIMLWVFAFTYWPGVEPSEQARISHDQ